MKSVMKKVLSIATIAAMFSCSMPQGDVNTNAATAPDTRATTVFNRAPSANPPGGLQPHEVPQFVTFGYDDNGYSDGMQWSVDLMKGRTNPAGVGNARTFDGTPATVSYYNCTYYSTNWISESPTYVKRAWRAAYEAGHEIGNHTKTHGHGNQYSIAKWNEEIDDATAFLTQPFDPNEPNTSPDITKGIGLTASEIYGFRTPYLEYNDNLFQALKDKNMYDCSIEEGFQYLQDGTNFLWPYTLDNGSPGHDVQVEWGSKAPIQPQAGMWEMPVYTVIVPPELRETMKARQSWFDIGGGKITGFDYNLWVSFSMTKAEFLATLKHTLDLRLAGNRAPFMLGTHSDYYSTKYKTPAATTIERREALKEFLDYAQTKSAVRIVSINRILEWVKNPVALDTQITHTVTPTAGPNGTITPSAVQTVKDGATLTFTLTPAKGHMVDQVLVNGQPVTVSKNQVVLGYVDANTTVEASFKAIPAGEPFQLTYYWTYDYHDEPVDMTTPMVDMLDIKDQVIATVPEALAKRIAMEGSGFIPDGRLLNLNNSFDWPESRFLVVDQAEAPYGYDANGQALVPYRSVAADPSVIPMGADLYVHEFDGVTMPNGMVHDGWFVNVDTSHSFSGFQIDIFAATYPEFQKLNTTINKSVVSVVTDVQPVAFNTIMTSADPQGSVWPEGEIRVKTGNSEKYYFFPQTGFVIDQVLLNGTPVAYDTVENTYFQENITADGTLHVKFKEAGAPSQYTITSSAVNGTITASQTVTEGGSATFEFAPNAGFVLDKVLVDGAAVTTNGTSYTFANVRANATIQAVFKDPVVVTYTVATSKVGNGTIDAAQTVEAGANVTISFAPAAGNYVDAVIVNGQSVTVAGNSYTFTNVTADQTIEVVFAEEVVIPVGELTATYTIGQDWGTGFGANIVVKNNGTTAVTWTVTLTYDGNQKVSGWNGNFSQTGNVVTITPPNWAGPLAPGATYSLGMNGSYTGTNNVPVVTVK